MSIWIRGAFELPQPVVLQAVLLGAIHDPQALRDAAPEAVDARVVHEGADAVQGLPGGWILALETSK